MLKLFIRSIFSLLAGLAFLSACSGLSQQSVPQARGTLAQFRHPENPFATPTPLPLVVIAGVDIVTAGVANPIFALTSDTACFANDGFAPPAPGGGGEHGDGGDGGKHDDALTRTTSDEDGHHHHHGWRSYAMVPGTPWTPSSMMDVTFGAFVLTDPCTAPIRGGGSGHGRGDDALVRKPQNFATPPPPGGGGFIVAFDSSNPTVMQNIDGPSQIAGNVYTFPMPRFLSHVFLAGHTYTFALAAPATPTPAPTPTPAQPGGGDD